MSRIIIPVVALSLLATNARAQVVAPDLTVTNLTGPSGNAPYYEARLVSFTVSDANGSYSGNVDYQILVQPVGGGMSASWQAGTVFMAGGTGTFSDNLVPPPGVFPGVFYTVLVRVDPSNLIPESNENNNVASTSASFGITPSELVARAVTAPPEVVHGQAVTVSWEIQNVSGVEARDFVVRLLLSDSTPASFPLYDSPPMTLGPGLFAASSTTVVIPPGAAVGMGGMNVIADVLANVPEGSETNNQWRSLLVIRAPAPDFTIAVGDVPMAVEQGQSLDLAVTIANDGEVSGQADYALYLSPDANITTADIELGASSVALAEGTVQSTRMVVDVPSSVAPGDYYLGAIVDPSNVVTETDETNNTHAEGPITVFASPLSIVTRMLPDGVTDVSYAAQLVATGNTGTVRWSISSGALPDGISVLANGELVGRPTRVGTFGFVVAAEDDVRRATATLQIIVQSREGELAILTNRFPSGIVGEAYEAIVVASGGPPPYVWQITGLPDGLRATTTGEVRGTPVAPGVYDVLVVVRDARDARVDAILELEIDESAFGPRLVPADLPPGALGVDYCEDGLVFIHAIEGRPPYAFSIAEGGVPGLELDPSGVLCGTPTMAGMHSFVVQVRDATGAFDTERYSVLVDTSLRVTNGVLPTGSVGLLYRAELTAEGGVAPYTWSVSQGTLPAGLSLSELGVVSGTPTTVGLASLVVQVEDAAGGQVIAPVSVQIVRNDGLLDSSEAVGCGCSATAGREASAAWWWLAALVLVRRRR